MAKGLNASRVPETFNSHKRAGSSAEIGLISSSKINLKLLGPQSPALSSPKTLNGQSKIFFDSEAIKDQKIAN